MKRVQIMEFEDQPWFPSWLRTCMTNNIIIMARLLGVPHALGSLLGDALEKTGSNQVVDLGSGSGGVMPEILHALRKKPALADVSLILSDKFPNQEAIEHFNHQDAEGVRYFEQSVDATSLESTPPGFKTMVNCFHHMSPHEARSILRNAVEKREPLLIYEMGGHQTLPFPLWLMGLPIGLLFVFLMAFIKSALVRPLTFQQVFFTYVIPLIPIFYAWDGHASMSRIYRLEDLDALLEGLENSAYSWEKGFGRSRKGGKLGSYLLGTPN